ncbi:sigma factor-like helix-turn-helix DNA-binding protein [Streptomyces murinus]|uniref:sigma factor-like helix-turn-helix DNA-binding protein n=1 Tax=Streptomyces murinus TaxID=33900 RepID=UPI0018F35550|nr:sigma factor-like helix-turn-helix DNA-binding protein [Streptomyces murinus]
MTETVTERQASMLLMRGRGCTHDEIGEAHGVTGSRVTQLLSAARRALGARDVTHALAIFILADQRALEFLRREIEIPDQAREALRDFT